MRRSNEEYRGRPVLAFTPSGVLWLAVALLVGFLAWFKSLNLVLMVVYVMVALVVLNGVLAWLAVRRVKAGRIPLPPMFAGERAECGVRVSNHSSRPVTVTALDRAGEKTNSFLVYRLPGRQT